jgi:predicted dehydrogenase
MNEPIGVAVIGAGGIADSHLYSYQRLGERVRRVAVVDVDESRAARAAERFEFDEALLSYQDVLARDDVHAVSICTPPFLHVEMSVAALQAGKHVLCEKPVAPTLSGLDEIEAAARESGCIFSGVFQLRFGRGAQQLRALADEGKLGDLHLGLAETMWWRADAYYDDVAWRGKWSTEAGGATVSQAVHIIDMLIWLMGEPERIYAEANSLRPNIEVDDNSIAIVRFKSGAIGQITNTVSAQSEQRSLLEFHGSKLSAISQGPVYDATVEPFLLSSADEAYAASLQLEMEERMPKGYRMLHRGSVTNFIEAIAEGRSPAVTIDDCRRALQVTTAIYESAMTQQPVTLPIEKDDPFYSGLPPDGFALPGS